MFFKASEVITEAMIQNHAIKTEDRELYRYGVQQSLLAIMNICTFILIGVVCKVFWQSVVFILAYIPLRHYAGGFHAKTPVRCYLYSIVLITAAFLAIRFIPWTNLICGIILLINLICVLILSPVESVNKRLDALEKKVYRKRSYLITIFEICFAFVCMFTCQYKLLVCLTMETTVISIMLIWGEIDNRFTDS
jgi:accessory gene regulator B